MSLSDSFPIFYAFPFLVFAVAGASVTRSRAWRGVAVLFGICIALAAVPLTILGGLFRARYQDGGFSLFGFVLSAIGFAVLLLPSAIALGVSRDRGASARLQLGLSLGVTILVGAIGFPFFALTVGCILTGECV